MTDNVRITLDTADLKAGVAALGARFPVALTRALSRTATSARALMVQEIAADTGLGANKVRAAIAINKYGKTAVQVEAKGKRIPLIEFGARGPEPSRGKGRGVSYRLPTGRGNAPHAFIATMPTGHRGVFERKPNAEHKKAHKGGRTMLPIRELFGPSIVNVFRKFLPDGAKRATEALRTNLQHEVQFALTRR